MRICVFILAVLSNFSDGAVLAAEWAVPTCKHRVAVTVDPGSVRRTQCPVGAEFDFARLFKDAGLTGRLKDAGLTGRLNVNSIRVVRFDPASGKSIPFDADKGIVEVPYQLTGDFPNDDAGRIWWRMVDEKATHFHVYFQALVSELRLPPTRVVGLIGIGDTLHYNNGQPGTAPVHPLHSQFWHLDWDGDGQRDLIGFAYRRYEFGYSLPKNLGNGIYFLKNIGSAKEPLFAPRRRLKGDDGQYLETDLLPQNMFPVDWDRDGAVDFIGVDSRKNLLLWRNTGRRDRDGLFVLAQPRLLTALTGVSEFREKTPGPVRKPSFYIRAIKPVDWDGDGGRDLVVTWANTNILQQVDSKRGVIPYGAPLQIFELFEDVSKEKNAAPGGEPVFAPPRVITEERGLPINAACFATGGVTATDWDGDGDYDLLFQDVTNRPLDGGRLMFAENFGTRRQPKFLMPIPILRINDSPQVLDWNDDGLIDLIAGGEFFENVNLNSRGIGFPPGDPLPAKDAHVKDATERVTGTMPLPRPGTTPGGSRLPRAKNFPQLVSRGRARQVQPELLGHWAASADWNGDGTLDLVRGMTNHVQVFINRGTTLNPVFEPGLNLRADGHDIDLPNWLDLTADPPSDRGPQGMGEAKHSWPNPTIIDFDRDGDLDLFVTSQRWQTLFFENVGSRTQPVLTRSREVRYQGNPQEFSWRSKVSLGDLDADGVTDLVAPSDETNVFYAYHPAPRQTDPTVLEFDARRPLLLENGEPLMGAHTGQNNNGDNHSLLVDWDNDGDLDLINGSLWHIYYYENIGTPAAPRFKSHGRMQAGGADIAVFRHAGSVDAADWNGDGRLDLLVSTENPSDQPLGEVVHLFDRAFLDNNLPTATTGKLETNDPKPRE